MFTARLKSTVTTFILSLSIAIPSFACTNITLKANDNSVMVGRTMEFGPSLQSRVIYSPQGKSFTSKTMNGQVTKSWKAKYSYLFLDFFNSSKTVDGMNNQGLSFGYLYLPGYTEYQQVPQGQEQNALSYLDFGDWILGNFSNVNEVKEALKNLYVFAQPASFGSEHNVVFPLHAIVTDANGKSITIEFVNGKMQVTDNVLGVLTNSPPVNWQMNNLKNYANLSPYSPEPINIDGVTYSGTGQGSGAVGLPGDFTPPSRFVKMAFLVKTVEPAQNATQALNLAQHIINNADIPNGSVRGTKGKSDPNDTTQWTVFKDLKNHVLYFKSYGNTSLKAVYLDKLQNINMSKAIPVSSTQTIEDVTGKMN